MSLYQHGRLVSLPGRIHPKTGRRKKLIEVIEGEKVNLKIKEPQTKPVFKLNEVTDNMKIASALSRLSDMSLSEPKLGNRHTKLWSTSTTLLEAGFDSRTVYELIARVNDTWENQKTQEELRAIVEQAQKRATDF